MDKPNDEKTVTRQISRLQDMPEAIQEKQYNRRIIEDILKRREHGDIVIAFKEPQKVMTSYNYKIKFTGRTAEAIYYKEPIQFGYKRKSKPRRKEGRTMANEVNIARARKAVYDIVNTNYTSYTKMLTLTYRETTLDYHRLYLDWQHFIEALRRKGYRFPYLYIVEHQTKRGKNEGNQGSLHVHALLFTDEYIPFKICKAIWTRKGSVHIEHIDKADDKGAYVAKYITKEAMPADKKAYRTSRDIKRPTYKAGLGTELDMVSGIGNEYSLVDTSDYTVKRGTNQDTGEVIEDVKATSYHLRKE